MLKIVYTTRFKKDARRMKKRGRKMDKLETIIRQLVNQIALPIHNRDHSLIGNYNKHRECHIEPDWILIYRLFPSTIQLERTGTHSDLF